MEVLNCKVLQRNCDSIGGLRKVADNGELRGFVTLRKGLTINTRHKLFKKRCYAYPNEI